jgi:hypothetical protein
MADIDSHKRFGVIELIGVLSIVGAVMVAYGQVTDRVAVMEHDIAQLKVDVRALEDGNPLVNARLDYQREALDKLTIRVDALSGGKRTNVTLNGEH